MARLCRGRYAATLALALWSGSAAAVEAVWTGNGDGTSWRDPANWSNSDGSNRFPDGFIGFPPFDPFSASIDNDSVDVLGLPPFAGSQAIIDLNDNSAGAVLTTGASGQVVVRTTSAAAAGINVVGDVRNDGIIVLRDESVGGASSLLRFAGNRTLSGTGSIVFDSPEQNIVDSASGLLAPPTSVVIDTGQTIRTNPGAAGGIGLSFINRGLIEADGGTITLSQGNNGLSKNESVIKASNGGTVVNGFILDNHDGTISIDPGSQVHLVQGINGGVISGGGDFVVTGNVFGTGVDSVHFDGVTVKIETLNPGSTGNPRRLGTTGDIVNDGVIEINDVTAGDGLSSALHINGVAEYTGNGEIVFKSGNDNFISAPNTGTHQLTLAAGQTVRTDGAGTSGAFNVTTVNNGLIDADGGTIATGLRSITNNALIRARNGGVFAPTSTVDNTNGVIDLASGSRYDLSSRLVGGVVQGGGTIDVVSQNLAVLDGVGITLDDVTLNLDTTGTTATRNVTFLGDIENNGVIRLHDADAGAGVAAINVSGTVNLTGNGLIELASAHANSIGARNVGTHALNLGAGQTLRVAAGHAGALGVTTSNRGTMHIDGTLTATSRPLTNEQGGLVTGSGLLDTGNLFLPFVNGGTIAPGGSTGILTVDGQYRQAATGELAIEIGGPIVDLGYDRLVVTGSAFSGEGIARLDGLLTVDLINGFIPDIADEFVVLTAETRVEGMFANTVFDALAGFERLTFAEGSFLVDYRDIGSGSVQHVVLFNFVAAPVSAAVPEPASMALVLAGLIGLAGRARRRRPARRRE